MIDNHLFLKYRENNEYSVMSEHVDLCNKEGCCIWGISDHEGGKETKNEKIADIKRKHLKNKIVFFYTNKKGKNFERKLFASRIIECYGFKSDELPESEVELIPDSYRYNHYKIKAFIKLDNFIQIDVKLLKKIKNKGISINDIGGQKSLMYVDLDESVKEEINCRLDSGESILFTNEKQGDVEIFKGTEGKTVTSITTKYERDPNLRKKATEIHGYKCFGCGFDFKEKYGEYGIGYIEIHHKKPLYSYDNEVSINPAEDLEPLCSNCHRIAHRKRDRFITSKEIKEMIKNIE